VTTTQNLRRPSTKVRREDVPEQIITAAMAVFSEHGLGAARLGDVAQRAGVARSTLHLHFATKEELFREVLRETLVAHLDGTAETMPSETATSQLRHFAERHWRMLRDPALESLHRLLLSELLWYPELAHFYATQVVARAHRLLAEILARGMASGEFRSTPVRAAARLLMSTLVAQAFWCNNPTYFGKATGIDDCGDVLPETLELMLRALAPSSRGI
jgi:AcrR family transcriptional regulator